MMDALAPVGGRRFRDAAPVLGRQWLRYLGDTRSLMWWVGSFSACGCARPRAEEAGDRVGGVGFGGTALSGGARGVERWGDGDRCRPALWRGAPDGAWVVAEVRGSWFGRSGGCELEAGVVSASDGPAGRGAHRGVAASESGLGAPHDRESAAAGGVRSGAGAFVGVSGVGSSSAD